MQPVSWKSQSLVQPCALLFKSLVVQLTIHSIYCMVQNRVCLIIYGSLLLWICIFSLDTSFPLLRFEHTITRWHYYITEKAKLVLYVCRDWLIFDICWGRSITKVVWENNLFSFHFFVLVHQWAQPVLRSLLLWHSYFIIQFQETLLWINDNLFKAIRVN